jgi:hypothetical protein
MPERVHGRVLGRQGGHVIAATLMCIYADLFDDDLDAVGAAWTRCDETLLWPR